MFKKICLILVSTVILYAEGFNQKIVNMIGYEQFNINRSLIEHLFSNKSAYYQNGSMNYLAVMEKLKANGLLNVGLNKPQTISITFHMNHDPIKSLRIISDSLKSLGYYYYFTKNLIYDENQKTTWSINLKTEAAIDPLMLSKELAKNNCSFEDIKKEGDTKWMYRINTANSVLSKAKLISVNERIDFRKPLKPYLIKIQSASKVLVRSKAGNQWFPNIVFYDKHLNILNIVKEDNRTKNLEIDIPQETKYIKIDDLYTLSNIKRGLSVMIKE